MNRDSNTYTFIFAIIMVLVVASILAFTATELQPTQAKNVKQATMQNILHTVGIDSVMRDGEKVPLTRPLAQKSFDKYITKELGLDAQGNVVLEGDEAFKIDLAKQLKTPVDKQVFPLYVADVQGKTYYIVPLRGSGLWDAIWGYIALDDDVNTIKGVVFDHKAETTGLGGEITKDWFQQAFTNEKIYDPQGNMVGVSVVKGYTGGNDKDDNKVDAISGATLTGDGVTNMISERLKHYIPYFEKHTDMKVSSK